MATKPKSKTVKKRKTAPPAKAVKRATPAAVVSKHLGSLDSERASSMRMRRTRY